MIRVIETGTELFKFLVIDKTVHLGKNAHLIEKVMVTEPPKIQMASF